MRIAILANQFPAISETFIMNHALSMQAAGHEVHIRAGAPGQDARTMYAEAIERFAEHYQCRDSVPGAVGPRIADAFARLCQWGWRRPGIAIECLNPFKYGHTAMTFRVLCETLPKGRGDGSFDVIHCHFGPNGRRAIAAREVGAMHGPIITTFHGYDVNYFSRQHARRLYKRLFQRGDRFTVGSEFMRARLSDLGAPATRISKVPMSVSTELFPFFPRSASKDGVVSLLSVARLTEVKGIEYAIRAVAALKDRGRKLHYVIAGDGALRGDLQRLAGELGLDGIVRFVGAQPHDKVRSLYAEAQLFLFPGVVAHNGEQEGQGLVLLEAQASGLPIVATTVGGIPESVLSGRSATLVPPRDAHSLAEALDELISQPQRWAEMGRVGRDYVCREFDGKVIMARLEQLYAEVG